MLVLSVYALTDCSSPEAKDELYRELYGLLRRSVVVAGDFNTQLGCVVETKWHIGGYQTDNGNLFIQVYSGHRLFLPDTNLVIKSDACSPPDLCLHRVGLI